MDKMLLSYFSNEMYISLSTSNHIVVFVETSFPPISMKIPKTESPSGSENAASSTVPFPRTKSSLT